MAADKQVNAGFLLFETRLGQRLPNLLDGRRPIEGRPLAKAADRIHRSHSAPSSKTRWVVIRWALRNSATSMSSVTGSTISDFSTAGCAGTVRVWAFTGTSTDRAWPMTSGAIARPCFSGWVRTKGSPPPAAGAAIFPGGEAAGGLTAVVALVRGSAAAGCRGRCFVRAASDETRNRRKRRNGRTDATVLHGVNPPPRNGKTRCDVLPGFLSHLIPFGILLLFGNIRLRNCATAAGFPRSGFARCK